MSEQQQSKSTPQEQNRVTEPGTTGDCKVRVLRKGETLRDVINTLPIILPAERMKEVRLEFDLHSDPKRGLITGRVELLFHVSDETTPLVEFRRFLKEHGISGQFVRYEIRDL